MTDAGTLLAGQHPASALVQRAAELEQPVVALEQAHARPYVGDQARLERALEQAIEVGRDHALQSRTETGEHSGERWRSQIVVAERSLDLATEARGSQIALELRERVGELATVGERGELVSTPDWRLFGERIDEEVSELAARGQPRRARELGSNVHDERGRERTELVEIGVVSHGSVVAAAGRGQGARVDRGVGEPPTRELEQCFGGDWRG